MKESVSRQYKTDPLEDWWVSVISAVRQPIFTANSGIRV
jgi:hypothetical protein